MEVIHWSGGNGGLLFVWEALVPLLTLGHQLQVSVGGGDESPFGWTEVASVSLGPVPEFKVLFYVQTNNNLPHFSDHLA